MALLKIVGHGETSSVVVGWKEMKINVIVMQTCVIINFKRAHNVQDAVNIYSQQFVQTL